MFLRDGEAPQPARDCETAGVSRYNDDRRPFDVVSRDAIAVRRAGDELRAPGDGDHLFRLKTTSDSN
jgi:hypothetical protein